MDEPSMGQWEQELGANPDEPKLAEVALRRAILIVKVRSGLEFADIPTDATTESAALAAVFETAQYIYDSRELRSSLASGMASERIGSWTYTLRSDARVLDLMATPTGVQWLDMFLNLVVDDPSSIPWSTGIDVFDEDMAAVSDSSGRLHIENRVPVQILFDPPTW